jgi:hypothetical protein
VLKDQVLKDPVLKNPVGRVIPAATPGRPPLARKARAGRQFSLQRRSGAR